MAKFRIQPHARLQEWVAEELGYFKTEGLDYEFVDNWAAEHGNVNSTLDPEPAVVKEVKRGALESMQAGRSCEVSSACHWMVNLAASSQHGHMWGHAYSVAPSGIYVPQESPIQKPSDLAHVEVAVGYHSGSHFSALQALEACFPATDIELKFVGRPLDRLELLFERKVPAGNVFGTPIYVLEQQGFRKIVDTTFMIGFLLEDGASDEDTRKFFNALKKAQRAIDIEPERYRHYLLKELPNKYHKLVEVSGMGLGERMVFEPYTREVFERTHRWVASRNLFAPDEDFDQPYESAVTL